MVRSPPVEARLMVLVRTQMLMVVLLILRSLLGQSSRLNPRENIRQRLIFFFFFIIKQLAEILSFFCLRKPLLRALNRIGLRTLSSLIRRFSHCFLLRLFPRSRLGRFLLEREGLRLMHSPWGWFALSLRQIKEFLLPSLAPILFERNVPRIVVYTRAKRHLVPLNRLTALLILAVVAEFLETFIQHSDFLATLKKDLPRIEVDPDDAVVAVEKTLLFGGLS